jgi:ankyrin repeat protein
MSKYALFMHAMNGDLNEVMSICTNPEELQQIDINEPISNGESIFYVACVNAQLPVIRFLFTVFDKIDINIPNDDNEHILHTACGNGDLEVVTFLCEHFKLEIEK